MPIVEVILISTVIVALVILFLWTRLYAMLPIALCGGALVFILWMIPDAIIMYNAKTTYVQTWKAPLASFRTSDGIKGSWFLASGSLESTTTYHYYVSAGGGYIPKTTSAHGDSEAVMIFEENRTDGEMVVYEKRYKSPKMAWFATQPYGTRTEFHIPNGSLVREFKAQ